MNGTGYPSGLVGQAIPLEARIVAVADAYDAMTHDRPYRAALTPLQAMEELQRCSPEGYDRECVDALATIMNFNTLARAVNASRPSLVERATAGA
jgi:HD-GYP domain-containing protein (c-di-GMP phosphodiesterase class II)